MAHQQNGPVPDPTSRRILEELRDMRVEMRADRRSSDERFERMMREFREDSARRETATQKALKDLRTDIRTVGLAIVKTLNRNTRILEHISGHHGRLLEHISQHHGRLLDSIDRKLGVRGNGRPRQDNGRGA